MKKKRSCKRNSTNIFPQGNKMFLCIKSDQWLKIDSKQARHILRESPFLKYEVNRIKELCHRELNEKFLDDFEIYAMHVHEKDQPEAIRIYFDYIEYNQNSLDQ